MQVFYKSVQMSDVENKDKNFSVSISENPKSTEYFVNIPVNVKI